VVSRILAVRTIRKPIQNGPTGSSNALAVLISSFFLLVKIIVKRTFMTSVVFTKHGGWLVK